MTTDIVRTRARDAVDDFMFWLQVERQSRRFAPNPKPKPKFRKGDRTPDVIAWLKAQPEPQLVEQMSEALGINAATLRTMLTRHPDLFEQAGSVRTTGGAPARLWRAR